VGGGRWTNNRFEKPTKTKDMANPNPYGYSKNLKRAPGPGRPNGSINKLTRERVETELRFIALSDPLMLFQRTAKGATHVHVARDCPDAGVDATVHRVDQSAHGNLDSGDGTTDQVVEVKLCKKNEGARAVCPCPRHVEGPR
jgi:hypothetical protein